MKNKEYQQKLKAYARENRTHGTRGEATLWKFVLKAKQTGYQFNRQFVIDKYIVDFICRRLNLIIEIDGSSHINKENYDFERQTYLERKGYFFLRFSETEVIKNLERVSLRIHESIQNLEGTLNSQSSDFS